VRNFSFGSAHATGVSSGIGATYADRLAGLGSHLVRVAWNRERLESIAARLHGRTGVTVEVVPAHLIHRRTLP
jgi:uncharacterized protein